MNIAELRVWAAQTYGAQSHKELQITAALNPLSELLKELAKHGIGYELGPFGSVGEQPRSSSSPQAHVSQRVPPVAPTGVPVAPLFEQTHLGTPPAAEPVNPPPAPAGSQTVKDPAIVPPPVSPPAATLEAKPPAWPLARDHNHSHGDGPQAGPKGGRK